MKTQYRGALRPGTVVALIAGASALAVGVSSATAGAVKPSQLVPPSIRKSGTLVVGVNVPYAPLEFLKNGKLEGFDIQLMDAAARRLGLKAQWRQQSFTSVIPSIAAGTDDAGVSYNVTPARAKVVTFVSYFNDGVQWASRRGKAVNPNHACGLTVAVQQGTTEQQQELPALSKKCVAAHKQAIKTLVYADQSQVTTAVILGKADAMSADSPVTAYAIKQTGGRLQAAGPVMDGALLGWPVAKGSSLATALLDALKSLITDGQYSQIAAHWGVQSGKIAKPQIFGGAPHA